MMGKVLILGATGKTGSHFARAFASQGWEVKKYDRKTDDMSRAAMGCDVIVNGLNPPNYESWETQIPRITAQVLAAAKASGATVIVPGNVYVFGSTPGVWDENTPHLATTKKGKVRIEMEQTYRQAATEGVRTIILRAGDFIDPFGDKTLYGMLMVNRAHRGTVTRLGGSKTRHAYAYLPDFAKAGVALAEMRNDLSPFEDIPFPGHCVTPVQIAEVLSNHLGKPMRLSAFPWWTINLSRPFWRLGREIWEMRYLNDTDHCLSDARIKALLPTFSPTPLPEVLMSEVKSPNVKEVPLPA